MTMDDQTFRLQVLAAFDDSVPPGEDIDLWRISRIEGVIRRSRPPYATGGYIEPGACLAERDQPETVIPLDWRNITRGGVKILGYVVPSHKYGERCWAR